MIFGRRRHPVDEATLNAFVDEQLGAQARARVQRHAETCSTCRQTLVELRALRQTLSALPRAQAPRSFALREADVRSAPSPATIGRWSRAPTTLSGVAMAALLAFAVLVGVDVLGQPAGDGGAGMFGVAPSGDTRGAVPEADGGTDAQGPNAFEPGPGLSDGPTAEGVPSDSLSGKSMDSYQPEAPQATLPLPTSTPRAAGNGADGNENGAGALRIAEAGTAALTLAAGGSLAFVWWRRRRVP